MADDHLHAGEVVRYDAMMAGGSLDLRRGVRFLEHVAVSSELGRADVLICLGFVSAQENRVVYDFDGDGEVIL